MVTLSANRAKQGAPSGAAGRDQNASADRIDRKDGERDPDQAEGDQMDAGESFVISENAEKKSTARSKILEKADESLGEDDRAAYPNQTSGRPVTTPEIMNRNASEKSWAKMRSPRLCRIRRYMIANGHEHHRLKKQSRDRRACRIFFAADHTSPKREQRMSAIHGKRP